MKDSFIRYLELAKICKAVYPGPVNQNKLSYNLSKLDNQKIIHGSFGRGYLRMFWNSQTIIFAFRGTREGIDWLISNILILPVQLKDCDQNSKGIKIHFGFQSTLNYSDKTTKLKSIDAICKHINDNNLFNGREIVITGHSLGGALAILFAVKLRYLYKEHIDKYLKEIVVFGSPSVGLNKFKLFYKELNNKTVRIVNESDIVPFTPPILYCHVGTEIWLNKEKWKINSGWRLRLLYAIKFPAKKFMEDHSIKEYIKKLNTIILKQNFV